jgi:putative transposase
MVKSLSKLDRYRWSGHSVLVGCRRRTWQDRGEILSPFGLKKREAVRRYRDFIEDGFNIGRREILTGGGLRRSAGGCEGVFEEIGPAFREKFAKKDDFKLLN